MNTRYKSQLIFMYKTHLFSGKTYELINQFSCYHILKIFNDINNTPISPFQDQ